MVRARQNVLHEAGLFQGRLGFARAILLPQDGVEAFSDGSGVHFRHFARGENQRDIRRSFGNAEARVPAVNLILEAQHLAQGE
ncbi:MAG: nucleotide-binding protein [Cyanobacteria bacterium]|nr:nucleotide-binding protein [Cyanobacteriota bacterium]